MAKKEIKKEIGLSVKDTISALQKKFGEDSVMILDQATVMKVETIPTGSFGLDMALGVGGFPKGRVIEISGPEASGKTTLALHTVAEAQKKGGICAYIDTEHALDPQYAKSIGVNSSELIISQPACGEDALDMVESLVRSGQFAVIVIDSVASLTPKAEIEGEMGDPQVGRHAKLMSHAMRKLVPLISGSKTVVIFINQIRMMIGQAYGNPEFTTGGKALKFYSSVRLDIRRIAQIKKGDETVGGRTRVKVIKNKVASPFKQTEFDIIYGEGISHEGEILALGERCKVLKKQGTSYYYNDQYIGRGYDASRTFLKENPEVKAQILTEIRSGIEFANKEISESEAELTSSNEETV